MTNLRMSLGGLLVSLLVMPAVCAAPIVIEAARRVGPDGQLVADDVALVVDNGIITQVGGSLPADVLVQRYEGAVLCAGLIDVQARIGAAGAMIERANAVEAELDARDAFDRYSQQLRAALRAGVTSFVLAADDSNLVGGQVAICQTSGPGGKPQVLSDPPLAAPENALFQSGPVTLAGPAMRPMKLSLSPEVFKVDRAPTSREGALNMLRETLDAARTRTSSNAALGALAAGQLAAFVATPTAADVLSAADLADAYGLQLTVIHTADARQVAALAAKRVNGVVVGPLELTSGQRAASAAGLFAQQGVPVAIAGGLPATPADSLRLGAAVAARNGLTPALARLAITSVPAKLLGIEDRVGDLKAGLQADVVVFSGDPLDLRTRVLAVYVRGELVFSADAEGERGPRP